MSVTVYSKKQQAKDHAERNRKFKAKFGRDMNYEDVLIGFGAGFCGQSQISRAKNPFSSSEDDGVLNADLFLIRA